MACTGCGTRKKSYHHMLFPLPLTPTCITLLAETSHDGSDREDAQGNEEKSPRDKYGEEGKPVPMSTAADAQDSSEALNLALTVTRAEGLSVTTPRHTFRMPKNNPTQRRYVRLSVLDIADERAVLASAVTSAVSGNKPGCVWGDDERGETLNLVVDKAGQGTNEGGEEMPLQSSRNKKLVLEVEAWRSKTETGGDDILLGRGQIPVGDSGLLGARESEVRWVALFLDDKPKGKIEISVSAVTNAKTSDGTSQLEEHDQEIDLEQHGRKDPVSDGEIPKRDDDDDQELRVSSEGGSEGNTHRKRSNTAEENTDAPEERSPKTRTTKWGLPSMPDLKSTLNASLARATNMIAKQPEAPTNNDKQPEAILNNERDAESEDGASKEGTIGEGIPEGDGEWQSVIGDEADRRAISKKSSLGKTVSHGMPGILGARHGMLSLKESLQARLTGASGKLRTEHESGQDEGMVEGQSEDDGAHREIGAGRDPVNNDNTPVLSYSSLTPDQGQGASAITLPGRQALDMTEKQPDLENIFTDADDPQSLPAGTLERKRTSRESSRRASVGEGGRRAERRQSRSRADSLSPLRSLLQDATADQAGQAGQDESDSEEERQGHSEEEQQPQREEEAEDGEGEGDHEHVEKNPAGSGLAKWSPAHTLSVPVVASSVKEAAARVKSSLSSPKFSGSLKSFRWNRHKEDSFTNDQSPQSPRSPQRASTDDAASDFSPTTPTSALEADTSGNDDEGDGSLGSGSSPSPPVAAAAVLVKVFRASDLPDVLTKTMFGRTKKDGAQDPYVLLKLHQCEAVTSTAQREGQECTWGSGDEGEAVEITIPVSKIPDEGLESSKLIVEMRSKATDVREKDALLSSTEIPLIDWLGKKATWADLESTGSPGGRVKLSVALAEKGPTPTVSKLDSHKDPIDGVSDKTAATTEIFAIGENDIGTGSTNITSTNMNSDAHGASQDLEQDPQPSMGEHGGMAVIAERDPGAGSIDDTSGASSETGKGIHARRESVDASRRSLRSLPSDENSPKASDREESAPRSASGALQEQPETGDEVVLLQESAGKEVTTATSSHDIGPKDDAGEAFFSTTDMIEAIGDRAGDVAGVESALIGDNINITVLVQEADSLAISLPQNAFGRPKKNATQDPYVVLRMCGGREATSAVVEGGSKCQWPGTAGEAVCLTVLSADLTAAGWGQAEVDGPHLTVEVWNQESPNRQGDIFIGSADVKLKDHLGSGPSWVELRRRRSNRGRVMIDVSCPILQQSVFDAGQKIEPKTKRPSGEGNFPEVIERADDTRRTSSELLEGGGGAEAQQKNRPGQAEQAEEEQDGISNMDTKTKDHEPVHRSSQVASDRLDKDDRPTQEEESRRLSDAGIEAFRQVTTAADSSPSLVDAADSFDSPALTLKERQKKTPNAQEAEIGEDIEEVSNVPTADITSSNAAANGQSARFSQEVENDKMEQIVNRSTAGSANSRVVTSTENVRPSPEVEKRAQDGDVHDLSRQRVFGTATPLDLTASGPISDPQVSPKTKQESMRVEGLATDVTPVRDHSESESTESIQPGSDNISQPTRSGRHEGGDGGVSSLHQSQRSRSKSLKKSDDIHSDGALSGGLNEISDGGLQAPKPSAPHDPSSSTQPRSIEQDEKIPTQQKLANNLGMTALNHSPACTVAQAQTEKRLVRAREIARRRRRMISGGEPAGRHGHINASPGFQPTGIFSVVTAEQARAVTTIQGACRGRAARRRLRARQRAAIKIQAVCRGYVSRRECTGLRARTKRANVEEKQARQRRSRMAATQKVCVCVFCFCSLFGLMVVPLKLHVHRSSRFVFKRRSLSCAVQRLDKTCATFVGTPPIDCPCSPMLSYATQGTGSPPQDTYPGLDKDLRSSCRDNGDADSTVLETVRWSKQSSGRRRRNVGRNT